MSFASTLDVLRPTLPCYLALAKHRLLRLSRDNFELHPNPVAPSLATAMAQAVFAMGASTCVESFVMSRTLAEGPKVFAFNALTCEALENFDLSLGTTDYLQPFPSVVMDLRQENSSPSCWNLHKRRSLARSSAVVLRFAAVAAGTSGCRAIRLFLSNL